MVHPQPRARSLKILLTGRDPGELSVIPAATVAQLPAALIERLRGVAEPEDWGDFVVLRVADPAHHDAVLRVVQFVNATEYHPFVKRAPLTLLDTATGHAVLFNHDAHDALPAESPLCSSTATHALFLKELELYVLAQRTGYRALRDLSSWHLRQDYPFFAAEVAALVAVLTRHDVADLATEDPRLARFVRDRYARYRVQLAADEGFVAALRNVVVEPRDRIRALLDSAPAHAVFRAWVELTGSLDDGVEADALLGVFLGDGVAQAEGTAVESLGGGRAALTNGTNSSSNGTSNVSSNGVPTSNGSSNGVPTSNGISNGVPTSNGISNGVPTSNGISNGIPDSRGNGNGDGAVVSGTNGHSTINGNGHTTNGHTTNGHTTNGHTTNGHTTNGHTPKGPITNGHTTNGHTTNGHTPKGPATNGPATNGPATNGHTTNGHTTNGHTTTNINSQTATPPETPTAESTTIFRALKDRRVIVAKAEGYGTLRTTGDGGTRPATRNNDFRFVRHELLVVDDCPGPTINGKGNTAVVRNSFGDVGEVFKGLGFVPLQDLLRDCHIDDPRADPPVGSKRSRMDGREGRR